MSYNNNFDVFHADEIYSDHMKDLAKIEKTINGQWHVIWEKKKGIEYFHSVESFGEYGSTVQTLRKGLWEFVIIGSGASGGMVETFWGGVWPGASYGGGSGAACVGTFKVRKYDEFTISVVSGGNSRVYSAKNDIEISIAHGQRGSASVSGGSVSITSTPYGGSLTDSTINGGDKTELEYDFYPGKSGETFTGTCPPAHGHLVDGGYYAVDSVTLPDGNVMTTTYGGGQAGGDVGNPSATGNGKSRPPIHGLVYLKRIGGLS